MSRRPSPCDVIVQLYCFSILTYRDTVALLFFLTTSWSSGGNSSNLACFKNSRSSSVKTWALATQMRQRPARRGLGNVAIVGQIQHVAQSGGQRFWATTPNLSYLARVTKWTAIFCEKASV